MINFKAINYKVLQEIKINDIGIEECKHLGDRFIVMKNYKSGQQCNVAVHVNDNEDPESILYNIWTAALSLRTKTEELKKIECEHSFKCQYCGEKSD
jgi:hypothetical protein